MLAMLLAVTMLPAAGLSSAFADEPVDRPATSGGDVALESTNADNAATASQAPIAEAREDGMLAAGGLMYTVADGGLSLVGFDGDAPEGALTVSDAVSVDGKDTPVVSVDLAEGQVAGEVVVLSLPQGIKGINTGSLASAFPNLLSVEIAAVPGSSLPAASGAASMRAAYSTSGGMLFRPTSVTLQADDGSIESIECKELLWAPPALVSARVPVECRAVAEGAFADARDLKTIVAFGTMERIADGAFSTEQMEATKVVVPASSPAVTDAERVSASMALMGDAGQKERRSAWHEAGWRTDDIVMGKPYGSLTETVAVTEGGAIERTELQLVSYPGAHENAMDLKKPNAEGVVEQAESGLAFTVKSDMTAIVTWQGDKAATPSHLDIPASVIIDGVTYPVTEIAPNAFEDAPFLTSITIPEGVIVIGQDAFKDCLNLAEPKIPSTLREVGGIALAEASIPLTSSEGGSVNRRSLSRGSNDNMFIGDAIELEAHDEGKGDALVSTLAATDEASARAANVYTLNFSSANGISSWKSLSSTHPLVAVTEDLYRQTYTFSVEEGLYLGLPRLGGNTQNMAHDLFSFALFRKREGGGFEAVGERHAFAPTLASNYHIAGCSYEIINGIGDSQINGFGYVIPQVSSDIWINVYTYSDHTYDLTPYAKTVEIQKWVDDNYLTKAATDLDNFYDKAKFNTISYEGLDEADYAGALPTFYVNDAGKLPKVPEPRREGHEFLGWTWAGQATPTKDASPAFSGGGAVTLTANWDAVEPTTPEARHFFTSDAPLRHDDASATQAHVIKVRLSSSPGTLASVSFEGDDRTGLLRDTSGVRLFVGASEDALSSGTELSWGGATPSGWSCPLAKLGEGSYGVYVGVSVPTSAIDEASIPVSYADGSYVASLVKMNYAFA